MTNPDDSALDDYLQKNKQRVKSKRSPSPKKKHEPHAITPFIRWKAAAAMDLIRVITVIILLVFTGLLMLFMEYSFFVYPLIIAGGILTMASVYVLIDFHHFKTWTKKLHFTFEGWEQTQNGKSAKFWDANGEHWVHTTLVVSLSDTAGTKHQQVINVFLKRLQKRLNQWTVSSETRIGYTQPNGWRLLDNNLSGDMNARVMNLIRKRLSGEFDQLVQKMGGSVKKVTITSLGKETRHEVYHDTD